MFVYVLRSEPDTLDPHVTYRVYSHIVMMHLFDTLIWQAPDGTLRSGLAVSWDMALDGLTCVFHLRPGVTFHDGTPFDARAAQFSFERIVSPETRSHAAKLLWAYKSSRVVDSLTLEVRLRQPDARFLPALSESFTGMVSPAAVESWGQEFGRHPVGTGPFRFDSWAPDDRIVLLRSSDYGWAPVGFPHQAPPHLEAVSFRIWQNPPTAELLAEADVVQVLPRESDLGQLLTKHRFRLWSHLVPGVPEGLAINATRPPCNDRAVRRAIASAVDAGDIVKRVHRGRQTQAFGPLSPASLFYDRQVERLLPHDPERSRTGLDEAGWFLRPGNNVRQKNGRRLSVSLFIHEGDELLAAIVREQLARVGIEVRIDLRSDGDRADACRRGDHHLANTGWMGNDPAVLDYVFQSAPNDTGVGWTHHGDSRLDDLLARGRREMHKQARRAIYGDIQRYILEEGYFVPIYNVSSVLLVREGVEGLLVDPRAYYVWLHGARRQPVDTRRDGLVR